MSAIAYLKIELGLVLLCAARWGLAGSGAALVGLGLFQLGMCVWLALRQARATAAVATVLWPAIIKDAMATLRTVAAEAPTKEMRH